MGKMLHSNLCSLADCNKHLWQLYTHNSDSWLPDSCNVQVLLKKNAPHFFVFLVVLILGKSVCYHMHHRSVVEHVIPPQSQTLYIIRLQKWPLVCVCVRHLRRAWFEFSCLCIFSCHDSHKHLHESCGFGLWICCLMGELPYIWHTDAFRFDTYEALCLLIMCLFLSKRERLPPVPNTVCLSVGHLSEGVCINAVICQWHGLETRTLSRSVLPKI